MHSYGKATKMFAELHQLKQTLAFHAIPPLLLQELILHRKLVGGGSIHLMLLRLSLGLCLSLGLSLCLGLSLYLCLSLTLGLRLSL